ncbi:Formate dehydrogenase N alpha subunit @ selenocysteine-containing [Citrobacter freundii]|uniref:Formate dehydrogenase N alpha subunit @ selenocysteine-containing n=1 Tax=Citrobacter freundii TaxID=546 RepID=A0A7G2IVY6_CITFR|nr:Formate dehydrogenase N alpha subunit @ selenocysteine-containing [Citrobacter freundii]
MLDYIHSETRLQYPEYRAPGSDKWQRISWDDAINRIARLMKDDRDANFIEKKCPGRYRQPMVHHGHAMLLSGK